MTKSYIEITDMGPSESGKTRVYYVRNKRDLEHDIPGIIKWHGPWRKYIYSSSPAIYDANCLREIADFINELMEARRAK